MTDTLLLLAGTIAYRPYVFAFLAAHAVAGGIALGPRRVLLLTLVVWATAFAAEYSSTRTGIPFGFYTYLENTRDRELYLANVPFMDSLSFAFLAFAAYATALAFRAPLRHPRAVAGPPRGAGRAGHARAASAPGCAAADGAAAQGAGALPEADPAGSPPRVAWLPRPVVDGRLARSPVTLVLAAALFTMLDVVIDPVALRGDRWFLGRIYTYPEPGVYFGVPLANFVGWFVVGLVGLGLYQAADAALMRRGVGRPVRGEGILAGVALYYAVLAFNLTVTFAIGERLLGVVGCLVHLLPMLLLLFRFCGSRRGSA